MPQIFIPSPYGKTGIVYYSQNFSWILAKNFTSSPNDESGLLISSTYLAFCSGILWYCGGPNHSTFSVSPRQIIRKDSLTSKVTVVKVKVGWEVDANVGVDKELSSKKVKILWKNLIFFFCRTQKGYRTSDFQFECLFNFRIVERSDTRANVFAFICFL